MVTTDQGSSAKLQKAPEKRLLFRGHFFSTRRVMLFRPKGSTQLALWGQTRAAFPIIAQYAIFREIKIFATKYAIFDPYIDCEDLYIRFQQDFKDLQSRMSLKKAPAASFHLMKLGDSLNFGKFRGFTIEQVLLTEGGLEYLEWLDDNVPGVYIDWKDVAKWKSNHIRIKYSTDSEETDYFNDFSKIIINK